MKCKTINPDYSGQFICFIDDRFEDVDLKKAISEANARFTDLVFFSEETALRFENIISDFNFIGNININLVGCASKRLIDAINASCYDCLKDIRVSPDDIYIALDYDNIITGIEMWLYNKVPIHLKQIEETNQLRKHMSRVESIINDIVQFNPQTNLERILLLDIWIQKHIQYISDTEVKVKDGVYICESITTQPNYIDILTNNYGSCEDIAFLCSLVLNNPRIGIKCRQIAIYDSTAGLNHSWNIVECDGAEYIIDFTHNITRSPTVSELAYMTTEYHDTYTLIGLNDFNGKYNAITPYPMEKVSLTQFDRLQIIATLDKLKKKGVVLHWDAQPCVPSQFLRKEVTDG